MSFDFYEDRNTHVRWQLVEEIDGVTDGKDLQAGNISVRLRAFTSTLALVLDYLLDKVEILTGDYPDTPPKKSGVDGYVSFNQSFSLLTFRVVLVDSAIVDGTTPTGFREQIYREFRSPVTASPQP